MTITWLLTMYYSASLNTQTSCTDSQDNMQGVTDFMRCLLQTSSPQGSGSHAEETVERYQEPEVVENLTPRKVSSTQQDRCTYELTDWAHRPALIQAIQGPSSERGSRLPGINSNQEVVCNWYPLAKRRSACFRWSVTGCINHAPG